MGSFPSTPPYGKALSAIASTRDLLAGPPGWVDRELYRPIAHKGTMGNPPRGPRGPKGFSDLGGILVKPSPGRDWGEIGTPRGFLGTIHRDNPSELGDNLVVHGAISKPQGNCPTL